MARNASAHLESTINSLLKQTLQPLRIIVVDDGSTDSTSIILKNYAEQWSKIVKVISLPDKGYDIRRVPSNINLASQSAADTSIAAEYFMISGDDCSYPKDYAHDLISRMMSQRAVVVSSGRPRSGGSVSEEHSPSGSGRMIKCSFWKAVGGRYPIRAGWETWLLYKAQEESRWRKISYSCRLGDLAAVQSPRGGASGEALWRFDLRSLEAPRDRASVHLLGSVHACARIQSPVRSWQDREEPSQTPSVIQGLAEHAPRVRASVPRILGSLPPSTRQIVSTVCVNAAEPTNTRPHRNRHAQAYGSFGIEL